MTRPEIQKGVTELLSITVGRHIASGEPVMRDSESAWDSLKHVELVFMLEDRFDVQFSEEEMGGLRSFDEIVHSIEEKRAA
jgi:acyl carrier protein